MTVMGTHGGLLFVLYTASDACWYWTKEEMEADGVKLITKAKEKAEPKYPLKKCLFSFLNNLNFCF